MSVYLDALTLLIAVGSLILYSKWLVMSPSILGAFGFVLSTLYLFAQTGWTVAFLEGDVWGRDFANYIWFTFNTAVFTMLVYLWLTQEDKEK